MKNHIRANLWLLGLSVVVCCVLYPLVLWAIGGSLFPANASGSLITAKGADGKEVVVGSRLIAQNFTKDWYFQPRPSAASFNATASGGSNWGANNPKLRDRIARQIGPMVRYNQTGPKKNDSVQTDIETWFTTFKPQRDDKPLVVRWASNNGTLAGAWVKGDANRAASIEWLRTHPEILTDWKRTKPEAPEVDLTDDKTIPFDDVAGAVFETWAAANPNKWPEQKDNRFQPVTAGSDLQATFFDMWLQAHPDVDLEKVPADLVMASGSGLDPHLTVRSAKYQLDRVAEKRAATPADVTKIKDGIAKLIDQHAFTALSGLVGEPLVNVLELNIALDEKFPLPTGPDMP
ncbi:MAG TPA: potassium-transporting ATPase subunit C [Gemmataceae bacterium]|jgi:K+-transporting ATPase ATPase C chain|nr:potassium-transporting ATPase subunit C [Gemmataceae bacterium]